MITADCPNSETFSVFLRLSSHTYKQPSTLRPGEKNLKKANSATTLYVNQAQEIIKNGSTLISVVPAGTSNISNNSCFYQILLYFQINIPYFYLRTIKGIIQTSNKLLSTSIFCKCRPCVSICWTAWQGEVQPRTRGCTGTAEQRGEAESLWFLAVEDIDTQWRTHSQQRSERGETECTQTQKGPHINLTVNFPSHHPLVSFKFDIQISENSCTAGHFVFVFALNFHLWSGAVQCIHIS